MKQDVWVTEYFNNWPKLFGFKNLLALSSIIDELLKKKNCFWAGLCWRCDSAGEHQARGGEEEEGEHEPEGGPGEDTVGVGGEDRLKGTVDQISRFH